MGLPRCRNLTSTATILSTIITITLPVTSAFVTRPRLPPATSVGYRANTEYDVLDTTVTSTTAAPLAVESVLWEDNHGMPIKQELNGKTTTMRNEPPPVANGVTNHVNDMVVAQRVEGMDDLPHQDLSYVEFVPSEEYQEVPIEMPNEQDDHYPFAAMLQGSARYIASHAGETAVLYIPGEWLHKPNKLFDSFLQDVALARLLGMKIVLVADCRVEADDTCQEDGYEYAHECFNALRATSDASIRQIEEEAGFVRFEVERKLNRYLRRHLIAGEGEHGNVVGGNFYSARAFGVVRGEDFEHTGFVQNVYTDNIRKALDRNDVVLLTTVGCSQMGDSVNVNGQHLAASVAASLNAYKLIYMSDQGSVMSQKGLESRKFFQEIPVSFAKELAAFHDVRVHKTGFATFDKARQNLDPRAVELLLNLSWAAWSLEQGVTRAHVVNPKDGALLEELFTSKNGANTCVYHDDENLNDDDDLNWLDEEDAADWDEFFAAHQAEKSARQ